MINSNNVQHPLSVLTWTIISRCWMIPVDIGGEHDLKVGQYSINSVPNIYRNHPVSVLLHVIL